jgi:uncharacterized protein YndB with AHSA1/START domain
MTLNRHESVKLEFPSALEILLTQEFNAPIELVFDVLTKPEHVVNWFAPFEDTMKVCTIDLRVGGDYHMVTVTNDGRECSFRGTYAEVVRPIRTVETWAFEGWPGVEAVEKVELHESDGVTTMTLTLTFANQADRDHMSKTDGFEATAIQMAKYLQSLLD